MRLFASSQSLMIVTHLLEKGVPKEAVDTGYENALSLLHRLDRQDFLGCRTAHRSCT